MLECLAGLNGQLVSLKEFVLQNDVLMSKAEKLAKEENMLC
jgi:hypothetical protein